MKDIIFTSGSCRVLIPFDSNIIYDKKISSIHYMNESWKGGSNFIGKLHTAKQHLYFLLLILNKIKIDDKDLLKLFSMKNDWACKNYKEYDPYYDFNNSLNNIRYNIFFVNTFVFEICSTKHTINKFNKIPRQNELVNEKDEDTISYKNNDELYQDIQDLIKCVNENFYNPQIILVGHLRNWLIDSTHAYIDERQLIFEYINEIKDKYSNVKIIDPIEVITIHDLADTWHYNLSGYNKINKLIEKKIYEDS